MTTDTHDPFLKGLEFFCSFFGQSASPESAISGLPLDKGRLTPDLFTRAAAKCGLEAKAVRRKLSQISGDTLPAILITKDGVPFVLTSRTGDQAEIFSLTTAQGSTQVSWEEIQKNYGGFVIHVRRAFDFEKRAAFAEKEAEGKKGHWFWGTLWSFRSFYARVGFATIFINLFAVTSSIFIMTVYDRVVPNKATDTLVVLAAGAGIVFFFDFILKCLRTWFVDSAGHRADLIMGSQLFEKILSMKFAARPASSGALANQVRAYEGLREFFTSATLTALIDLPFVFVFAGVVYLLGGIVALPMVIGLCVALLIGAIMQLPIQRAVQSSFLASNNRQAIVVESLSGLETIKTACAESALQSQMEDCINEAAKADTKSRFFSQTAVNSTALVQHLVSISIVIFAYFQVAKEEMTMGAMIACVLLSSRGMAPVGMVASLLTRLQQSRRSLSGLNQIMDLPSDKATGVGRVFDSANFEPSFSAEAIAFGFPAGDQGEISVLNDVGFKIKPGERIGLLGKIGSGKSTLIRLLLGLYEPTTGTIKMGGIDIRQLSPAQFRRRIGYVAQDTGLLYGTLRSNLTLAAPWLSEEAIWEGIHRAGLLEFVQSHPAGIDMPIAEGGHSLSGGQRQLVCLARALMLEPEILIFDEPTSSMDPGTEKQFKVCVENYLAEDKRRILIMATHKRSMLSLVERLIALDGGKIVNDGPKKSVLGASQNPGPIRRMNSAESTTPTTSEVTLAS